MRKLIFILIALVSFSQAQTIQYIGGPTTTVISRGNFRTDSIFYLPKRTKTPTDTAAFRYQISDSSLYYWTGYQWTKVQSASSFASVDTNIISTRAWRQKGIDSVQYNVGLKVNISDTASMLSPYIVGSGTSNYFPKFNATRSVVNSKLYESNLNLLFNSTTPYFTTSGISSIENNGTSASVYLLKTLDTARAYVSFGGANTMDINNLRAGDIRFYTNATLRGRFQTDGTFRLNSLTGIGSRIVVADDNGVLSATSSATGLVDTTVISTRAYRQKGDDSLGAIIATKGSGTVTSVATGYGLSGGTITTTGTLIADTALVASRLRLGKVADSLSLVKQNVLTNPVTGTGTTNYVLKFTGTSTIGNSLIQDNGTGVGIGGSQLDRLTIFEDQNSTTSLRVRNSDAGSSAYAMVGVNASGNSWGFRMGSIAANNNALDIVQDAFGTPTSRIRFFNNGRISVNSTTDAGFTFDVTGITRTTGNTFLATSSAEVYINTTSDAGAYTLQNNGALYNTGSAILAATSGSVGIGTTSPARKLDVVGGHIKVDDGFSYMWGAASTSINGSSASNFIDFYTNSTAKARINSAGNFGVGTVNPVQKFVVSNGGAEGLEIIPDGIASTNLIQSYNRSTSVYNAIVMRASDYNIQIGTTAAYYINASQESLFGTLTDAGNYRVQVSGNAYVTGDAILAVGASSNNVRIGSANASSAKLFVSKSGLNTIFDSGAGTDARLEFHYNGNRNSLLNFDSGITGFQQESGITFYFSGGNGVSVGSSSINSTAILDVQSTTKGFLPPRMTTAQRDAISSPAAGLVIYNTTTSKLQVYTTSWTDLH